MKFYRVHYYTASDGSHGFDWFTSKRSADRALNQHNKLHGENINEGIGGVDEYNFHLDKKGVLKLLSKVAVHPDNG